MDEIQTSLIASCAHTKQINVALCWKSSNYCRSFASYIYDKTAFQLVR